MTQKKPAMRAAEYNLREPEELSSELARRKKTAWMKKVRMNAAGTIQRRLDMLKAKADIARTMEEVRMDAQRSGKSGEGMGVFMA